MRRGTLLIGAVAFAFAACTSDAPLSPDRGAETEFQVADAADDASPDRIPGQYVVQFRAGSPAGPLAAELQQNVGFTATYVYEHAIQGLAAELTEEQVTRLRQDSRILRVVQDRMAYPIGDQANPPSWGLDRIDQRNLPLDQNYNYPNNGTGVTAYIVDTGILSTHNDFGGRVLPGHTEVNDGNGTEDCNGHGTHVASTTGGSSYGVAKNVNLVPVRVFGCTGGAAFSTIINAVNWVIANKVDPAVMNMSLGGGQFQPMDDAVANAVDAGVFTAVAAGNGDFFGNPLDACTQSPAAEPKASTVGATDINDNRASFSNFGTCVDIFGPGVGITGAWWTSNNATNTISGTSMATPHVAGVGALLRSNDPGLTASQVHDEINALGTQGVVGNPGTGSPNLLLYNQLGSGGTPPVADFTYSCDAQLLCTFDASSSTDPAAAPTAITLYEWIVGGTVQGTGQVVQHQFGGPTSFPLTLRVTDDTNLTDEITKQIDVQGPADDPPVASFTWNCDAQRKCTFDASGSTDDNGITLYEWLVGGVVRGTGQVVQHTFGGPANLSLTLRVTDTVNQTDTDTQQIVVP